MKKGVFSAVRMGAVLLALGAAAAACGGKTAQAQSAGGASGGSAPVAGLTQAAGAVKDAAGNAVKAAAGAAKGGGQPAAASDFVYELNEAGDGVVITGIQEDAKFGAHLVVPAEIEGFPVVAFLGGYNDYRAKERKQPPLESVVFPDSIIYLGMSEIRVDDKSNWHYLEAEYTELAPLENYWNRPTIDWWASFSSCESLKSVVFPKNLKIIPRNFASRCPSLTAEGITWPEAPEAIGPNAFRRNGFTELVIPEGVKFIGGTDGGAGSVFAESKTLKSVTIPESVQVIGDGAFENCPELTTVKIPAHPINYGAWNGGPTHFAKCPKLGIAVQSAISATGYPGF